MAKKYPHSADECVCGEDTWNRGTVCPCPCQQCHPPHSKDRCGGSLKRSCDACRVKILKGWADLHNNNEAILEKHRIIEVAKQFQRVTGISVADLRKALLAESQKGKQP